VSKRYLVTGGTGFIGAAAVRRLLADGHRVRVLDDNSRGHPRRLTGIAAEFEMIEGDVRDESAVARAAKGCDAVLHLAAVNGTEFFYSKPELVLDVGVRGMLSVVAACRANGVGDLVVASSSEVYQTPPRVPTAEDAPMAIPDPANPRYSYAGSKILTELVALNYGRTGFSRVAVFRPHNVYGPDMGWEHVIPQFAVRAKRLADSTPRGALRFPLQGAGAQKRAFNHIDDFTDGLARVLAKGAHLAIYHIGTPEETAMADLARLVAKRLGREIEIDAGPEPAGSTQRRCPDISRLAALGYAPKIALADGLGPVVDWYAANAALAPN
jgi:nucleoside-diphosphate-sugar epimerase